MSFLNPSWLMAALPLIALPVIIHLINQRRYQTVRWAAMMFVIAANRMSRGYARVRQWLILAARMAAIAGLALVIGRPLAGGYLGLAAGTRADETILILDRSPSMQQAGPGSGASKFDSGRRQLVQTLKLLGKSRWILIEGPSNRARELDSLDDLVDSPDLGPTAAPSDLPGMLLAALDHLRANQAGQADIWICSDLRENDWDADGGRWQAIRNGFLEFAQRARFHLVAYSQAAPTNLAVRVTGVRLQESGDAAELLISLRLAREGPGDARATVPVQFEIDGARSEVLAELTGRDADLKDHRIPLEKGRGRGWGKVSIPLDANPADDAYWFAFDRPEPRRAVVVAEDPEVARPLQLAASIAPDPALPCHAEIVGVDQLAGIGWGDLSLLLWQAPIPEGEAAGPLKGYVERGGRVIFFPSRVVAGGEFLGVRWGPWVDDEKGLPIDGWRGDQDLLAQTQAGTPLPVGQLSIRRYRRLDGEATTLATLKGGAPLLARVATNRGGVYFCSTGAAEADSTLASGGVVFYVMVQRALAEGASMLENTRSIAAGAPPAPGDDPKLWKKLIGPAGALSTDYAAQPGVYASGDRLVAVNRPAAEDLAPVLTAPKVSGLFNGLDFTRVDDSADNASSLIREIWRVFLVGMMAAMILEAALCLPRVAGPAAGVTR